MAYLYHSWDEAYKSPFGAIHRDEGPSPKKIIRHEYEKNRVSL